MEDLVEELAMAMMMLSPSEAPWETKQYWTQRAQIAINRLDALGLVVVEKPRVVPPGPFTFEG